MNRTVEIVKMPRHGKTVKGASPCGNPNRYSSADVVRFKDRSQNSQTNSTEDQTESDQYIQTLLKRQINKDVTLKEQFSKHRDFIGSSAHAPSVSNLNGLHNVKDHVRLDEYDSAVEYLKSCGLSEKEIEFRLNDRFPEKVKANTSGYGADPIINQHISEEIQKKLTQKEAVLSQPDTFNGGLELSRQALVLEKSILEKKNKESSLPRFLFQQQKLTIEHPDDPINHIGDILSNINAQPERLPRRERRKQRKLNRKLLRQQEYYDDASSSNNSKQPMNNVQLEGYNSRLEQETSVETNIVDLESKTNESPINENECISTDVRSRIEVEACEPTSNSNEDIEATKPKRKKMSADSFTLQDFGGNLQLVTEEDIKGNRMSLQDILKINKFESYDPGNPSKTMFVKNLPNFVSEIDLASLFGRYERCDASPISFRLLNGRMKGQAFITFPDIATCHQAITEVNGYKFGGNPIILLFGKNGNNKL